MPPGPPPIASTPMRYFRRLRLILAMYAFAAALPFTSRAGFFPRALARFAELDLLRRAAVLRDALRRRRVPPEPRGIAPPVLMI
jgi:hypothetical protein